VDRLIAKELTESVRSLLYQHFQLRDWRLPVDENQKDRTQVVHSQVTAALESPEVRELWYRLRSELTRKGGGQDACVEYLESELTRLKEDVRRALDWVGKA
jgi:hypothetical protein